jgi:hypothetical protein
MIVIIIITVIVISPAPILLMDIRLVTNRLYSWLNLTSIVYSLDRDVLRNQLKMKHLNTFIISSSSS